MSGFLFRRRRIIQLSIAAFFVVCVILPIIKMLFRITPQGLSSVFSSAQFSAALKNSITTALTATLISLSLAMIAAWCMERTAIKGKAILGIIFLIPMLIVLPALFGLFGLQAAQPAADICAFVLSIFLVKPVLRQLDNQ